MMVHTALTENPTKKPTIFMSIQTTHHQSLKKFLKKDSQFSHHHKIFFQESDNYYEKCLRNSGYKTKLQYQQPKENNQNKNKRNYNIWFNPLYSKSVKTNIRRIFIKLIGKHFPPNHNSVKIFNKNTKNLFLHAKHHIKNKWSQPKPTQPQKLCNCVVKEDCPINRLCLTSIILYEATIKYSNSKYKQKDTMESVK